MLSDQSTYYDSTLSNFSNPPAQSHTHVTAPHHPVNALPLPDHQPQSHFDTASLPQPSPPRPPIPQSLLTPGAPGHKQRKQQPGQIAFPDVTLNPINEPPLPPSAFVSTTVFHSDVQTMQPPLQQPPVIPVQQSIPPIHSLPEPTAHQQPSIAHQHHHPQPPYVTVPPAEHAYVAPPPSLQSTLPPPIYPSHVAPAPVNAAIAVPAPTVPVPVPQPTAAVVHVAAAVPPVAAAVPPAAAPPPPVPPHEQQYPIQTVLSTPSAIQAHVTTVPVPVTPPAVYPTPLQQKADIVSIESFNQPVDSSLSQSTAAALAIPIQPVVTHNVGTISGMSMADMVNQAPMNPSPEMLDSFLAVGRACRTIGRYDLAADVFRACMVICPDSAEANISYQSSCRWNGVDANHQDFIRPVDMSHIYPEDVFNDIGNALRSLGRVNEAEMAYRAALNIAPRHARAWNSLGNAMRARGAIVDAMSCYAASLTCQPGFAAAHCNLAGLLRDQGKPQEAEAQYRAALITDPNLAEAAAGLGTALRDMGRTDEAVSFYVRAVALQPEAADHHANLANTYKDLNRIEESIVSYQAALSIQPDMPDAFCNMVHSLSVICDWSNRNQNFVTLLNIIDKQLDSLLNHPNTNSRLYSTLVGALSNSTPQLVDVCGSSRSDRDNGSVSTSGGKEENSFDVYHRRRYIHHPSSPTVVRKAKKAAKFTKFMTNTSSVIAPVLNSGLPSVQPFHALIYPMRPEKFKALSAAYASRAESMVSGIPCVAQHWTMPRGPRARLKVGYVSSDYNNHPYSHLTQSIYGLHGSGTSVECYCYALTPSDQSSWRLRIERESEHFRDISGLTAKQSAEAIANDGIHVLVNCNGYTKGARTELFALRPAPVQVSFMGFPGTLGAHYIEYFITDVVTSPPELASRMHSESLLYHPHSYFVNDHRQTSIPGPRAYPSGPLTRAHYNLPEDCFLFIMHNQLYKLSPDTFDVWARILKRVPNSKIWLLRFPPSGEQRIRQEALARGLTADRLIFTDVAGKEEHVARAGLGDLFLDTPTCNAHTTGTDVLWSGVPMITCPGSLFASRVAASLLTAAGVPELIAQDMNAYEDLAVELATNRPKLAQIRAKIEASRYSNALFDTERWVRNVEALYKRAWDNYTEGNGPRHIFGQDVYEEDCRAISSRPMVMTASTSGVLGHGSSASLLGDKGSFSVSHSNNSNMFAGVQTQQSSMHNVHISPNISNMNNFNSNNHISNSNNNSNNHNYAGSESWHSESQFYGSRLFSSTIAT